MKLRNFIASTPQPKKELPAPAGRYCVIS